MALGDYMNAQCHACIGGTNVREDISKLGSGMHVVVGTPGRVFDMINRRALSESAFPNHQCLCIVAGEAYLISVSRSFIYRPRLIMRLSVVDYTCDAYTHILFQTIVICLDPRHIKRFVLDEADEMLSRGFKEQIYDVFRNMNENIQVCSALQSSSPI